jgi:hypothetical protein
MGELQKALILVFPPSSEVTLCLLARWKCDLGKFEKRIFHVVEWHWDLIFSFSPSQNASWMRSRNRCFNGSPCPTNTFSAWLTDPKCEFGEVEKAMFPGIERLWNLIFCLLIITKFDLVEIGKAILRGIDRTWVLFLPYGRLKMLFGEVEKAMLQWVDMPSEFIFCLLAGSKCECFEVEKATFQ